MGSCAMFSERSPFANWLACASSQVSRGKNATGSNPAAQLRPHRKPVFYGLSAVLIEPPAGGEAPGASCATM